jgi:hypothetical protein
MVKNPFENKNRRIRSLAVWLLVMVIPLCVGMACSFSVGDSGSSGQAPIVDDADFVAQSVELTLAARQPTQSPEEPQAAAAATTEAPTQEPVEAPTKERPTPPPFAVITEEPVEMDLETSIQNANILLYEDAGAAGLKRYVKEVLDRGGYQYADVAGEIGKFKAELDSGEDWDLIIVAAESRSYIEGEFFEYLNDFLNEGGAVIIETWYLDDIIRGKVSAIMDRCGFRLHKDWNSPDKYSRSIFWLQPNHPLLEKPNSDINMQHYGPYWLTGDVGDLLMSTENSSGVLVGGNVNYRKTDYGLLGVCDNGRLVLQTFSTHDYTAAEVKKLWENYIYYTLESRFLYLSGD